MDGSKTERWFISAICLFFIACITGIGYSEYLRYNLDIRAIEAGYEQKVEGTKVIWTKTNIEKVEQQ
jgi:hypothetical protein